MSSYTIRLQRLLNSNFDIWDRERPFPIYNEAHRSELEKMIEDHYYMQEIGFEVPQTFKHYLNTRMREIMPKYNAMYASASEFLDEEHFFTFKETGGSTENSAGTSKTNSNTNSTTTNNLTDTENRDTTLEKDIETRQYNYDTPMNMTSQDVNSDHMSSATINKADGRQNKDFTHTYGTLAKTGNVTVGGDTHSGTSDTGYQHETYDKTVNGQSPYKTIEEYRSLIFNIDKMIIDELADLFMMIF